MTREYLRVTPTAAPLAPDAISNALASFHELERSEGAGPIARLNPSKTKQPLAFEFVAISEGEDEPVQTNYGADARLDVVKQRLRPIYPSSFDIDRVELELVEKEERGLVRHNGTFWALGDADDVAAYTSLPESTWAANDRFGEEDMEEWLEHAVDEADEWATSEGMSSGPGPAQGR